MPRLSVALVHVSLCSFQFCCIQLKRHCRLRCGHLMCGKCLTRQCIKHLKDIYSKRKQRAMPCALCKQDIVHEPIVCYALRDSVEGLAEREGKSISTKTCFNWPPTLSKRIKQSLRKVRIQLALRTINTYSLATSYVSGTANDYGNTQIGPPYCFCSTFMPMPTLYE